MCVYIIVTERVQYGEGGVGSERQGVREEGRDDGGMTICQLF